MGWCQFALLISIQTRYEEEALIKAHGDRYIEYAAKVGRFFLNVGTFAPNTPEIIYTNPSLTQPLPQKIYF